MNLNREAPSIFVVLRRKEVFKRALVTSVFVGTLLTFINYLDYFLYESNMLKIIKIMLTYLVPFFVSIVSTYLALKKSALKV